MFYLGVCYLSLSHIKMGIFKGGGNQYAIVCQDSALETMRLPQVVSTKQAKGCLYDI